MKPEETIDFHIRWAWAMISKVYNQEAAKSGGTMSIGYVLLNIDKQGTPSTHLGPKMGMEPTSLTRTLKTMEENDLIVRKPDEHDGRIVRVFLTDKGLEAREVSRSVVFRFNEFVKENIESERLETFMSVMSEINNLLNTNNIFKEEQTLDGKQKN